MHRFSLAVGLLGLVLAVPARSETPPSPLRLIPEHADFLVAVDQPRRLVESLSSLDVLAPLWALPPAREQLESTQVRLFLQLTAYLEKELGAPWPELLDRLAGGGMALASRFGQGPQPALLVVQGRDEKLMQRFATVAVRLLEQELARRESREHVEKESYQGLATVRLKQDLFLAQAGSALLVSNNQAALHAGLDRYLKKERKSLADLSSVAEARRLLTGQPLAYLWLNMETVRKGPEARVLYRTPRDNAPLTILFGGYLDLLGRTPHLSAGLYRDRDELRLSIRMPCGREGMGPDRVLHLASPGQAGSRPVLEPPRVLYSTSGYLDLARIWQDRDRLFTATTVAQMVKADSSVPKFLSGIQASKLLTQAGPYYRVVVAGQQETGYKKRSKSPIPAFAVVWEMRQPEEMERSMTTVLHGAALLASGQVKLKITEEAVQGSKLVGWRFSESAPLPADVNDTRFAFSPCFSRVGNQFLVASTLELGRDLVDLLQHEQHSRVGGQPEMVVSRVYGKGIAQLLASIEEDLLTGTILDQAAPVGAARQQVKDFLALVRQSGLLSLDAHCADTDFHYDLRWQWGKK